jgi:cytochrome c553
MLIILAIGAVVCGGWPAQLALAAGDAAAGRTLFTEKQCARCHVPRGFQAPGPPLELLQRPQGEMELAGRLWNHLPGMAAALGQGGFEWPAISERDMANLMAFLQAQKGRDPAPDFRRGQLLVLRKGCLKCHSLRGEGGRVKPDLADQRKDYESAAAWAAAMWKHTPAMASMSASMGLQYPRFSDDEMAQLVGFLRRSGEMAPPPKR